MLDTTSAAPPLTSLSQPGPRRLRSRRGYVARRLGLVLLGLFLGLLLTEGALRLFQPIPADDLLPLPFHERRLRRLVKGDAYLTYDQLLGWTTSPGIRQRTDDVLYRHNAQGMRADREYAPTPPPGVRRIAAFGDSFTYCHEVNINNCWTQQLSQLLPNTEVLNFGVPGYGPDQAWLRYQREGPALAPCAVTIGYMLENINRVVNRYRPLLVPYADVMATKPRYILQGSGQGSGLQGSGLQGRGQDSTLVLLPNPATDPDQLSDLSWVEQAASAHDRWYFPNTFLDSPLDIFAIGRVGRTAAYRLQRGDPDIRGMRQAYRPGDEAFEVAGRVLIEFARQVQRDGAVPVVVIFSEVSELAASADGREPIYKPLVDWLAREQIPTVDVTPDLVAEARKSDLSAVIEHHYTPNGNRIVAQSLARQLPPLIAGRCGP